MRVIRSILPFILLLALTVSAQYKFETWTTEQCLPYKAVNSVLQTTDGYVWAATADGLACFDGIRFTVFNTANSTGLMINRLHQLAETSDGSLWTSGEENGLFRFQNGVFESFTTENGLPGNKIFALYADKSENRLLILTDKGLTSWQNGNFVSDTSGNSSFPVKQYFAVLDNTGAICVKETGILRRYTPNGIVEYKLSDDSPESLLTMVYQARDGTVWTATFYRNEPRKAKIYILYYFAPFMCFASNKSSFV